MQLTSTAAQLIVIIVFFVCNSIPWISFTFHIISGKCRKYIFYHIRTGKNHSSFYCTCLHMTIKDLDLTLMWMFLKHPDFVQNSKRNTCHKDFWFLKTTSSWLCFTENLTAMWFTWYSWLICWENLKKDSWLRV